MKREDSSEQGKIVTELMQHLHGCKNNCDVFFGRTEELERMKNYIVCKEVFVLCIHSPSGRRLLQAVCDVRRWRIREVFDAEHDGVQGGEPLAAWIPTASLCQVLWHNAQLHFSRPASQVFEPNRYFLTFDVLFRSICQQLSYTFLLPFEDIPDDTVPVTAFLKELLNLANADRPLLIFFDSVDELTGSQDTNKLSWLPLKLPPHCKMVVSVTCEQGKADTLETLKCLKSMIEDDDQFMEVCALGKELAWTTTKQWMKDAGRDLNNYQWRVVANAYDHCTLPIFCKLVFLEVCRWKSYFDPELTVLRFNVMDSVFQLFERVENKHGWMLVGLS